MGSRLLVFLMLGLLTSSCTTECGQDFFNFRLSPDYAIEAECILVGEELEVNFEYSDVLTSIFDTMDYDLRDYDIITSISIKELGDTTADFSNQQNALDVFNVVTKTGTETESSFDPNEFKSFIPMRSGQRSLSVAFTPLRAGTFYLSIIHGNAGVYEDPLVVDGCDDLILTNFVNDGLVNESLLITYDSTLVTADDLDDLIQTRALLFFQVVEDPADLCL